MPHCIHGIVEDPSALAYRATDRLSDAEVVWAEADWWLAKSSRSVNKPMRLASPQHTDALCFSFLNPLLMPLWQ